MKALDDEQYSTVVQLITGHARALSEVFNDKAIEMIIANLVHLGDYDGLLKMIRARAHATNQTVPQVMKANLRLDLVRMAVRYEHKLILEWLVTECQMSPFKNREEESQVRCYLDQVKDPSTSEHMRCVLKRLQCRFPG